MRPLPFPRAFGYGALKGYWPLDGKPSDFSGSGFQGTETSISYRASGLYDPGASFNGSSSLITFGNNLGFERTDSFSLVARIRITAGNLSMVMGKCNDVHATHTAHGYSFFFDGTNLGFNMNAGSGSGNNELQVTTSMNIQDSREHFVVLTYGGTSAASGVHIYLDGRELALSVGSDTLSASILNSVNFSMGAYADSARFFGGQIYEAAVYQRVLSKVEIAKYATAYQWQARRSRIAILTATFAKTASVSVANGASRHATAAFVYLHVFVRTAAVTVANAASRLASVRRNFIIKIANRIRWGFWTYS